MYTVWSFQFIYHNSAFISHKSGYFSQNCKIVFLKLWDINLVARVMPGSFLMSKSRELQVSDIIACRCDFQMWVYGIIFICFICNISTVVHLQQTCLSAGWIKIYFIVCFPKSGFVSDLAPLGSLAGLPCGFGLDYVVIVSVIELLASSNLLWCWLTLTASVSTGPVSCLCCIDCCGPAAVSD